MNAIELKTELDAKNAQWKEKYESFPLKTMPNGESARDIPANDLKFLNDLMADINEVGKKYEEARKVEDYAAAQAEAKEAEQAPVNRVPIAGKAAQKEHKTWSGELFDVKDYLRQLKSTGGIDIDAKGNLIEMMEKKTLMTTSANGYPPEVLRDGTVVPIIMRPPQLIDYLAVEPTNQNSIKFMAQTVRTNAAAATSEGSAVSEAVITYAEQTDIISKIGVSIPVTDEELEDEPGLRTMIDNDLVLMVRQVLDEQVTVGDGSDPNLLGIYNATNYQTQAKSTDPTFDAFMKAITKVNVTGRANANLIAAHSNDWQEVVLTRTADGIYILGNPTDAVVKRLWGLPVVTSESLTEGNGMVLDTFYFRIKMRKGVTLAVTDSHASEFTSNIQRIRATMRAGLKRMRGQAVCRVTGI